MDALPARGAPFSGVSWSLQDCAVHFAGSAVIAGLTLSGTAGSCTALVGPSGCGKTTLLRLLGGLLQPSSGSITCSNPEGTALRAADFTAAFCFQEPRLLPWLSALDNAALPLRLRGATTTQARNAALEQLGLVGLQDAAAKLPAALSGGMQMRVALARALVTQPQLLLLDEPFAAVDEIRRAALDLELRRLWERLKLTLVLVTHSAAEAAFVADRVCVLGASGGRIVADLQTTPSERCAALRFSAEHQHDVARVVQALHNANGVAS